MRHSVLREKRCLEPDFSADPLPFGMRNIGRVIAASATAKLRSKIRALNLIILLDLAPRRVADCAGDIDFEFQDET